MCSSLPSTALQLMPNWSPIYGRLLCNQPSISAQIMASDAPICHQLHPKSPSMGIQFCVRGPKILLSFLQNAPKSRQKIVNIIQFFLRFESAEDKPRRGEKTQAGSLAPASKPPTCCMNPEGVTDQPALTYLRHSVCLWSPTSGVAPPPVVSQPLRGLACVS